MLKFYFNIVVYIKKNAIKLADILTVSNIRHDMLMRIADAKVQKKPYYEEKAITEELFNEKRCELAQGISIRCGFAFYSDRTSFRVIF